MSVMLCNKHIGTTFRIRIKCQYSLHWFVLSPLELPDCAFVQYFMSKTTSSSSYIKLSYYFLSLPSITVLEYL